MVNLTYNKIFFDGLHCLKSDLDNIKELILKKEKLFNSKLEKTLFISELAEKIKIEKIVKAENQIKDYGKILMEDYEGIEDLYFWLDNDFNDSENNQPVTKVWIKDEDNLTMLSSYLKEHSCIEDTEIFFNVLTDPDFNKKANWLQTKTLLIYLFQKLKKKSFISKQTSENSFIQDSFLLKGELISNIKQSKNGAKNNKHSKPQSATLIDLFFEQP
jgi:hypothetical protein